MINIALSVGYSHDNENDGFAFMHNINAYDHFYYNYSLWSHVKLSGGTAIQ